MDNGSWKEYRVLSEHFKIKFYGDEQGSSGHYDSFVGDIDRSINGISDVLPECPFCGTWDFEVGNTHTPIYTIECSCGCELTGEYFEPKNKGKAALINAHKTALQDVINKWEDRV